MIPKQQTSLRAVWHDLNIDVLLVLFGAILCRCSVLVDVRLVCYIVD